MTNKQIAWYSILGYVVGVIGFVINDTNPNDGFGMFLAMAGCGVWIGFGIYGWVRLIKSDK